MPGIRIHRDSALYPPPVTLGKRVKSLHPSKLLSRSAEARSPVSPHLRGQQPKWCGCEAPRGAPGSQRHPSPSSLGGPETSAPRPHTPLWITPSGSTHLPPAGGSGEQGTAAGMSASDCRLGTAALPQVGSPRRRRAKQGHRGRLASAPGARPRQVTWARASASPWPLRGSHRQQGSLRACAPLRLRLAPGSPIQTDNAPRLLDRPMAPVGRG